MKRYRAKQGTAMPRIFLMLMLLAAVWPVGTGWSEAPIGRFVIGVYKPAGWSGGGMLEGANPNYDRFFTATDATNLSNLGVNLLVSTPSIWPGRLQSDMAPPDSTQGLEEEILSLFGQYGGHVVEQPSEGEPHDASGDPWPSGLHLIDFAGDPSILGHLDPVERQNHHNRLGAQVDSLAAKWTMMEYADGFFGYFIGHESDPKGAGGIYDSDTYGNLRTVIDSIRNHDRERAIVVVGNTGHIGDPTASRTPEEEEAYRDTYWTPTEQDAFGDVFFRSDMDMNPGPANILMNEEYILSCRDTTDDALQEELNSLGSLDRARDLINAARQNRREAEWYHIIHVGDHYRSEHTCWSGCSDGLTCLPYRRQPNLAELKAQAHLALVRGATGIVYYAYTSTFPDTLPRPVTSTDCANLFTGNVSASAVVDCNDRFANAVGVYQGLVEFASPDNDRDQEYAMYDTVKALNDTLAILGAALYPEVSFGEHRPLTWDDNYDNFSTDNQLSASTLADGVRPSADHAGAAGRLEFGQFHDDEAEVRATPRHPIEGSPTVSYAENRGDAVDSYQFRPPSDQDLSEVSYDLGLSDIDDSGLFQLDQGRVRFLTAPDFEAPSDADRDNLYRVWLRAAPAADDEGPIERVALPVFTKQVEVTVTNEDEAGEVILHVEAGPVPLGSSAPQVGVKLTPALSDPDGGISAIQWSWMYASDGAAVGGSVEADGGYTPVAADVGSSLRATVGYLDEVSADANDRKSAQSAPTAPVADVPAAPVTLAATPGDAEATLSWTTPSANGSALTGYEVRQSTDGGATWLPDWTAMSIPAGTEVADFDEHTVTGLTNGTAYTFELRALNGVGAGDSSRVSATPGVPLPPALATEVGNGRVSLLYRLVSANGSPVTAIHFRLYRLEAASGDTAWYFGSGFWLPEPVDPSGSSYDRLFTHGERAGYQGLRNGEAYTFEARAQNGVGSSPVARIRATPTSTPLPVLLPAPGLRVTAGDGEVTLEWSYTGPASVSRWGYRQQAEDERWSAWRALGGTGTGGLAPGGRIDQRCGVYVRGAGLPGDYGGGFGLGLGDPEGCGHACGAGSGGAGGSSGAGE